MEDYSPQGFPKSGALLKMSDDSKNSFKEWLSDRNIAFIIISILIIYALERFAKNLHSDVYLPLFNKCVSKMGCNMQDPNQMIWQKFLIHILELIVTIFILFIISRFVFKHGRVTTTAPHFSVPSSNSQIVPIGKM